MPFSAIPTPFDSSSVDEATCSVVETTESSSTTNQPTDHPLLDESKRKEYETDMTAWGKVSKRNRGTKPKALKLESQTLACLCVVLTCNNRQNGAGCFTCKIVCENAKKQQIITDNHSLMITINVPVIFANANVVLSTNDTNMQRSFDRQ
jgi:hypothetical protein